MATTRDDYRSRDRTLAQWLALLFGVAFLLVGILGFIPGITVNYDDMKFAGDESDAELFGLFQVSILHNIAHLLFGVGILAARRHRTALQYLLVAGILYVVLFVYGLIASERGDENFIPTNNGDDVLHAILALALLGSWAAAKREEDPDLDRARTRPV
jgi:cytochrome bd-type quinol oxidase subunit 2